MNDQQNTAVGPDDVPAMARAQFAALCRAASAGALLLVPLVKPTGAIVYSIGAVAADEEGGFVPFAFILSPSQVEGLRQATREDLDRAGHIPPDVATALPLSSPYGSCPRCGAPGRTRERRPDGNDTCANGHTYPSRDARQH